MPEFFKRLNFTFGNEDWGTEQEALRLKPTDRVLCVTGSGDRPLHLLMQDCKEIVSIDANPSQTHLLELKIAAMRQLPYEQYISFLGGAPTKERLNYLSQISPHMPHETAKFWNTHSSAISRGILYEGQVEKRMQLLAKILKVVQGKKRIDRLFSCENLEAQQHYVKNHWDRFLWRAVLNIGLRPRLSKILWKDPGLYAHVDSTINPGPHIHHRMKVSLNNTLARENFFMSFWLKGNVEKRAFPPYLTEQGVSAIQPRLNRISPTTHDLLGYLEAAPDQSFDCFSLSDVVSYIDASSYKRLMHAVKRTAKPGARFCIREFLSRREVPAELQPHFKRDLKLEQKLEEDDCCFVYRFLVGHIE
jgi:S-adenosylmethionine-diacylglycerol 3-amino-3-carboxypropyl transferase